MAAFIWLIIIVAGAAVWRSSKNKLEHYKYYMWNLFAKLFFGFAFSMVYLFYYGGGDTTAYFEGSITLNNLFFKSPELYFDHLFNESTWEQFTSDFDNKTGYPPGWIYREAEAFVICKFMSILSFFSLKSYFAMTFIMSAITAFASWKLYLLLRAYEFTSDKKLAIGVLFLPSVNFWCSGISKDTWVFIAVILLIYHAFKIISPQFKATLWNWIMLVFFAFIIYKIRSFILYTTLVPLALALTTRITNVFGRNDLKMVLLRLVVSLGALVAIFSAIQPQSEDQFLQDNQFIQEAAIIQKDFATNETYGSNRYSLGNVEFTPIGLARIAPFAIIAGIYRPFPWESLSPTLIFNGIESSVFLYFTFLFFRKGARKKIKEIRSQEVLMFAFFFVLIIAFVTGLTSGLFGVLVRLRAILLPFLFLLLIVEWKTIVPKAPILND